MSPANTLILIILIIIWVAPWCEKRYPKQYCEASGCANKPYRAIPESPGFQWQTKIIMSLCLAAAVQIIKLTFTR